MTADDACSDDSHSITRFIDRLKQEDPEAAGEIWQRYFERLLPVARARLQALSNPAVDEEDILVSVFDRFFKAARDNRFTRLADRDDLWQILLMLTERKVADQYRQAATQKRGGSTLGNREGDTVEALNLADHEPGPEFAAAFNDSLAHALTRLSEPSTREVALLRMEGCDLKEIAERLEISVRTIERKLRVIREVWEEEFE